MSRSVLDFADQLRQWGPGQRVADVPTLPLAQQYCRELARSHYENFPVVTRLLPADLRQPFADVYAYCRWADDLSDEVSNPQQSIELLKWWRESLEACYAGQATHPVFIALLPTIERFGIPAGPFHNLLDAFEQDQQVFGYDTFAELQAYCRGSADPVGRIVLYLCRCYTDENARLSDSICTGLQLANFWQDVARDADLGRRYLPAEDCDAWGYSIEDWSRRTESPQFVSLMEFEVERADQMIRDGLPLVQRVPSSVQIAIDLFAHGGLCILERIRAIGFSVWSQRPVVRKRDASQLIVKAVARHLSRRASLWWSRELHSGAR